MVSSLAPSAPPQNVSAVNGSSTSLKVSWTPPPTLDQNGIIRNYTVAYNRSSGSPSELNVASNNNNVTLSGLQKFVKYTVTVRAVTVADGPPSSPITVSTDQDSKTVLTKAGKATNSSFSFFSSRRTSDF